MGGYYDAGDHVKFGLPMAFSVTMMAWGAVDFDQDIISTDQMGNTLRAIRWETDYFLKAHTQPNVLWAQVITPIKKTTVLWQFNKPPSTYSNVT